VIEFRILGPLEVLADERPVALGGPKVRALLAVLLLHRGEVVSTDRLIDALWGEQASPTAAKTVQVYVSNLRKALGDGLLVTRAPGYVLQTGADQVDLDRFTALAAAGRDALQSNDPQLASATLRQALALWRGPPLADFGYESFAQGEIARLEDARLAALEDRIDADLAAGEHAALVSELEPLVRDHPWRERLQAQLMLALYRSGRQADALESYRHARRVMVEERGLEPGRPLQELDQAILAQDPALDAPSRKPRPGPTRPPGQRRHSAWLIAAGGTLLAVVVSLVAARLAGSSAGPVRVEPNSVAAIDPHTNTVVAAVPVGSSPGPIAFGSGSLWVANVDDQTVSRVDPASLRTLHTFSLSGQPTGVAATAGGIWVVQTSPQANVSVNSIDPQYNTVGETNRFPNVIQDGSGAVAYGDGQLWVAPSAGLLTRLDPVTGRLVRQVDPNAGPSALAIDAGGALWVADTEADNVTRVDPTGLLTHIAVGNSPNAIAFGGNAVWVVDSGDDTLKRIDPATNSVVTTIPVGNNPTDVVFGFDSVWVANSGDGTVTRVDPTTNKVTATITFSGSPRAITFADGRVWVTVGAPAVSLAASPQGGVLRIDSPIDVDSMDPALAYYTDLSIQMLGATCAKLLNYPDEPGQAGSQLTAEVAVSLPSVSADRKTYTFTIRKGFYFSPPSNAPVTAETFQHTIERSLSPKMPGPFDQYFGDIVGAAAYMASKAPHISGVSAQGNKLTIRLLAQDGDLPARLAMSVFCAVPDNTPPDPKILTPIPMAGPYYIFSYHPGEGVVLKVNPNYRGSRPHSFAEIVLAVNVIQQRGVPYVQAGTADYYTLVNAAQGPALSARYGPGSPADAKGMRQFFIYSGGVINGFALNTRRPLFSNLKLRQAVNYAINRTALAHISVRAPPQQPTDQYLPPGTPGSQNVSIYPLTPNLVKARQLAGGLRATAVMYTCEAAICTQQSQIVKDDLAAIGIDVQVDQFSDWYKRVASTGPWDIGFFGWQPDYPDPANTLNYFLEDGTFLQPFNDQAYGQRLTQAAELSGPNRYLTYGKLALDLERNGAPWIVYGDSSAYSFFSARVGCQYFRDYGVDLAALCIRNPHT
jgi:YVTN family beta-propeller protein